jgi:hypothetical protein
MSEAPETPVKKAAGPIGYIVAFVWGVSAVTLLYSLWRTIDTGPDGATATLLIIGVLCAGVGVALSRTGSSKPKP